MSAPRISNSNATTMSMISLLAWTDNTRCAMQRIRKASASSTPGVERARVPPFTIEASVRYRALATRVYKGLISSEFIRRSFVISPVRGLTITFLNSLLPESSVTRHATSMISRSCPKG